MDQNARSPQWLMTGLFAAVMAVTSIAMPSAEARTYSGTGANPPPPERSRAVQRWAFALELDVLTEINAARADPRAYAAALRRYETYFYGKQVDEPGHPPAMTTEGVVAVDEAIRDLERQAPAPPLRPSDGMVHAASRLVVDLGPKGRVGHVGSDGSTMRQRIQGAGVWAGVMEEDISFDQATAKGVVRQLVVDDGVPTRGHRSAIFAQGVSIAGVACGPHAIYQYMCVVDFAGGVMRGPGAESGQGMSSR